MKRFIKLTGDIIFLLMAGGILAISCLPFMRPRLREWLRRVEVRLEKERDKRLGINKGLMIIGLILLMSASPCFAQKPVDFERLADAIYKAEGGAKTKHPYGILAKYKTTTPRQACLNTIKRRHGLWLKESECLKSGKECNSRGFIEYLSKSYCPIGAKNDPTGLNKNWVKNVWYFYDKA